MIELAGASSVPDEGSRNRIATRRVTAASAITSHLREDIVAMRLLPGSPVAEKDVAARYGVSRTPVREALIRLAEEGLVEIRPQAGTSIARIPLGAIPEAVLVRQALECALVEAAIRRDPREAASQLDRVIARQEAFAALGDREAFHEADEAFHETMAGLAGHPGIWRLVRQAKVQIDRCRRLTLPVPGRMGHVVAEHRTIRAAIAAGDATAAVAAMRDHLHAVLPDARLLAERHPDYFV